MNRDKPTADDKAQSGRIMRSEPYDFLRHLAARPDLLRSMPSFFSEMLDILPAAIYHSSYDPDSGQWLIRYVSKGIERLLGYKPSELENKRSFKELLLGNLDHYRSYGSDITAANARFRHNLKFRDANGHGKWCSDDGVILFDQDGRVRGSVGVFVDITDQVEKEMSIEQENLRLKTALRTPACLGGMVGTSKLMQNVYSRIIKMALSTTNLVIIGESGTGKELAAKAIHDLSNRSAAPFVAVNCSSISENLFESEFFGHKKGSFTGALDDRRGYLDSADGGTLFLDEVGEIPPNLQTKLLRVLDGYGYIPVGDSKVRYSGFRLIAATNRNLGLLIRKGMMREDFYYRINAITLYIPPLRKRQEDIPILINHFLGRQNMTYEALPPEFFKRMLSYSWPGNIRELQNVLSRYLTFQETDLNHENDRELHQVLPDFAPLGDLSEPLVQASASPPVDTLHDNYDNFERHRLLVALNNNDWDPDGVARQLGHSRSTIYRKMKKYGLLKRNGRRFGLGTDAGY